LLLSYQEESRNKLTLIKSGDVLKFLVTQLNSYFVNLTGQAGGAGFTQWHRFNWKNGMVEK
jgi:hypothetical protein